MSDDSTNNIVLEHLRAIRSDITDLKTDVRGIREDVRSVKQHMAGFMTHENIQDDDIIHIKDRLNRIERRLDIID